MQILRPVEEGSTYSLGIQYTNIGKYSLKQNNMDRFDANSPPSQGCIKVGFTGHGVILNLFQDLLSMAWDSDSLADGIDLVKRFLIQPHFKIELLSPLRKVKSYLKPQMQKRKCFIFNYLIPCAFAPLR